MAMSAAITSGRSIDQVFPELKTLWMESNKSPKNVTSKMEDSGCKVIWQLVVIFH